MRERLTPPRAFGIVLLSAALLAVCLAGVGSAAAASPSLLTRFPEDAAEGSGADQLNGPRALASNPNNGRLYVADVNNNRISEFDPWGVFVKAWGWGVKDGSPALQTCGPPAPEVSPPPSLCREGLAGAGPGQLRGPNGVAVDAAGDIYVLERENARVQKFNPAGQFLLMFGGKVDQTTNANVCTVASADVCGAGVKGTGNGEFEPPISFIGNYMAVGSDGTVYVGDRDRIQEFEPDGAFKGQIKFADLHAEDPEFPATESPGTLAFDTKSGDLYLTLFHSDAPSINPLIYKLNPATGRLVGTLEIEAPGQGRVEALVTDGAGDVYATLDPAASGHLEEEPRVLEFGPSGNLLIDFSEEFAAPPLASEPEFATRLLGLGSNSAGDLYVSESSGFLHTSSVSGYGSPPIALAPPPTRPPVIAEQFAVFVDTTGATVKAKINPHFFADTSYYVEYGPASCETSSCAKQPTPPGSTLTSEVVNAPVTSAGVLLPGLQPNTTYHYRFVAQSSGGGPVKGLTGKVGTAGEATFTTPATPSKQPPCPGNQAFRLGPAALLPDCRAYEMVSPVDKNGADISVVFNVVGDPAGLDQASSDGEKLSYSAYRAFGEVESAPYTSQYLATRTEGVGWTSEGISPPRKAPSLYPSHQLDSQYKGFSSDICQGWVLQDTEVGLADGAVAGSPNLYRRDICAGSYEALAPLKTPSVIPTEFTPELQGFSADGSKAFFTARGKLTNNASSASQLYEASEGQLRLVCIRPDRTAIKVACTAGDNPVGIHSDRSATLSHAVSDDGSTIYWTEAEVGLGKLFVRVGGTSTIQVSASAAQFWTASADGSKAFYSVGGQLFEFDLTNKSSTSVASGFLGVMGASEDASKVYLVSSEALDTGATAGKPNLYLYEPGTPTFHFIATLASADVDGSNKVPSSVAPWPIRHVSTVTADGETLAFMSSGRPTGYDNTDAASGQADTEVYLYRAGSGTLACVSCLASGARPTGRNIESEAKLNGAFWVGAQIPAAQSQLHFPRVLSADGTRLFFESFDPLALRDSNAHQDVYEWELLGVGNCTEATPGFDAALGGCVNPISSGESPEDSSIVDSSADGRDVFFKTTSSLLPQDPELVDIYDARAAGGFPPQEPEPSECEGESCQHPGAAPTDTPPSSNRFQGPGNSPSKPARCPKNSHRVKKNGQVRCGKGGKGKSKNGRGKKSGRASR